MCLPGIGSFGIFHKTMTAAMPLISDLDFPLFSLATVSILFLREKKTLLTRLLLLIVPRKASIYMTSRS